MAKNKANISVIYIMRNFANRLIQIYARKLK